MTPLVEVEGLSVSYSSLIALNDVSCHVNEGTVVGVIGANGAGKTTLLRALSGIAPVDRGEIRLGGKRITGLAAHKVSRLGVQHVPEGHGIFPSLSVRENLALACYKRGVPLATGMARVVDVFPILEERLIQRAGTLSGGQQQMLALAPMLIKMPRVLLLDEISMGLAPVIVKQLYEVVRKLAYDGATILVVEQYVSLVLNMAEYVYVLKKGDVVWHGASSSVERAALQESYLK
jgi:branched-chain amino acid transport system ATP-binding protein